MKLGCIGYGNMASAILGGLAKKQLLPLQDILVFDTMPEKLQSAQNRGLSPQTSIKDVFLHADMILLAVKPKDFTVVLSHTKGIDIASKIFISIAAGISIEQICAMLGTQASVVRTMPNTPLLLGMGTTAICRNNSVSDRAFDFSQEIFACAGTVYQLPESQFDQVINVNGSSPAYIYLFAKTVAEYASQKGGIPYEIALQMFCDTLKGSAEMLQATAQTPDELIQAVSSPGGTTVAALQAFEQNGFTNCLYAGFDACVERAQELGK